ncbi:MAG: site-specific integrase [Flavobacteriaceae bacterium]|nr:site-specific integrase [Aequorivita sp.]MCB0475697.1 site-specific integrase [Flavobacteriaceae bacterium]
MNSTSTFGVTFFIRLNSKQSDNALIFVRVTVNGKRIEISLQRSVPQIMWDSTKSSVRGNSQEARIINNHIQQTRSMLYDCYSQLKKEGRIITASVIKARFLGTDNDNKTLTQLLSYHNQVMVKVLRPGTLKNYRTTESYIQKFLTKKYGSDVYLRQLNYAFVIDFEMYLHSIEGLNNNGLMKHMERLKKLFKLALRLEWIDKDPSANYQLKFDRTERGYLTEEELKTLEEGELEKPSHQMTRDIFVFACYTGLSYADVKNLESSNIIIGIDGSKWISTQREKTSTAVRVPILDKAKEIMDKYADNPKSIYANKLLPVYSNQKMNQYIKEVCTKLEIQKDLTFHVARHTFATTVTLSNGVPIETVSKLLGHTKIATTQIYARVIERKVSEDMQFLRKKLNSNKKNKSLLLPKSL